MLSLDVMGHCKALVTLANILNMSENLAEFVICQICNMLDGYSLSVQDSHLLSESRGQDRWIQVKKGRRA